MLNWNNGDSKAAGVAAQHSLLNYCVPCCYVAVSQDYLMLNWNNGTVKLLEWLHSTNLSNFPADKPNLPYVVSSSNRGATWKMSTNPYHRYCWSDLHPQVDNIKHLCPPTPIACAAVERECI
jgi:hypothetical protein